MTIKGKKQSAASDWMAVRLPIGAQVLEKIASSLFALGAEGLEEKDDGVTVYFAAQNWNEQTFVLLKEILSVSSSAVAQEELQINAFITKDWNAAWKHYFKPFRASKHLVVYPPWERYLPGANERAIVINPQMAFGTGHHESTRLALLLMEKYFRAGYSVLDVGTGSGILAIYAAQLGAEKISAVDVDALALENAAENSRLNGVTQDIRYFKGGPESLPEGKYDFIIANINRLVILGMAPQLTHFAKSATNLLLSGLLLKESEEVENAFIRQGWHLRERLAMNQWQALALVYG